MTIHVPHDVASLIEDAVRFGNYDCEADVIRDALLRLRRAMEMAAANTDQSGAPVSEEKPLTVPTQPCEPTEVGLKDASPGASSMPVDSDAPAIEDDEEVISEVAIRDRLIEWLAGFLP